MKKEVQKVYRSTIPGKKLSEKRIDQLSFYLIENKKYHELADTWQKIEKQVSSQCLTSQWKWVDTWLQIYKETVDYWFVIAAIDNIPCGITLITKEKERHLPFPVKAYHIGTAGEAFKDRIGMVNNRVLVIEKYKPAFYTGLIEIIKSSFDWEEIVFDEFNQEESDTVLNVLQEKSYAFHIDKHPVLFYDFIKFSKTPVLETLSKDTRYKLRRSMKLLDNDLQIEWAEKASHALDIQRELITLYNATWKKLGKRSMFDSKRFTKFQEIIIPKLLRYKSVILFRVRSKKIGTLGCLSLFVDNGVAYGYQLGFNDVFNLQLGQVNNKRLRIGYILHTLCMEECRKRGIKAYNFSLGIYPYKKDLSNAESEVVTISVRRGIKPTLRDGIVNIYNKLNASKKTPMVLQILRKVFRW